MCVCVCTCVFQPSDHHACFLSHNLFSCVLPDETIWNGETVQFICIGIAQYWRC